MSVITMPTTSSLRPRTARPTGARLTGKGRRFLLSVLLLALMALLVTMAGGAEASGQGGARATVVVQEGQTLSEIAAHELPELSTFEAVQAINHANHLNSDQVEAGAVLVIPGR